MKKNTEQKNRPTDMPPILKMEHPGAGTRAINKLVIVAMLVLAGAIGVLLYWSFESEKVLEIHNSPFPVRTIRKHPTAGGVIILKVDYCKVKDVDGELRVSYVSESREIFLPLSKERGPVTCADTEVPILIPNDLPPDTYKIKFRAIYNINPLKRNVISEFESRKVEVDGQN